MSAGQAQFVEQLEGGLAKHDRQDSRPDVRVLGRGATSAVSSAVSSSPLRQTARRKPAAVARLV